MYIDAEACLFQNIAKEIKDGITDFFSRETHLDIIAEPGKHYNTHFKGVELKVSLHNALFLGRFFCGSCVTLVVKVIGKRYMKEKAAFEYYINDGIFGNLSAVKNNYYLPPVPLNVSNVKKYSVQLM